MRSIAHAVRAKPGSLALGQSGCFYDRADLTQHQDFCIIVAPQNATGAIYAFERAAGVRLPVQENFDDAFVTFAFTMRDRTEPRQTRLEKMGANIRFIRDPAGDNGSNIQPTLNHKTEWRVPIGTAAGWGMNEIPFPIPILTREQFEAGWNALVKYGAPQ